MRVLHVSSGNLYGGVEALLITLARCRKLCPDMEPHFALSFEGRVSRELVTAGAPVYHLGGVRASRPWTIWKARRRLRALLQSERFEAVICHMPWPLAMFGSTVRPSSRLVLWLHSPLSGSHWVERWAGRITPQLAICNSRFTASSLGCLFPGTPQITIYCPVESELEADALSRTRLREQLEIPEDGVAILQVSRMEAWKGHLLHLRALAQLKDLPKWTGWFVGGAQRQAERTYSDALRRAARDLGISDRVRFLGQRSDVPELLAAADLFCQPNQGPEPFGIVFIEALLAGLPVVSTAIGGVLEIIDDSCGRLVPPANLQGLSNALREMVLSKELRRKLGDGGRARATRLCDPQTQLTQLSQALASAL